jgi:hypothetical protein
MLADLVVVVHLAIVVFIAAGLRLIYIGAGLRWAWVRGWRWRAVHLAAIVIVAAEAILGIACPLTVWEDALQQRQSSRGFIERWVDAILFYDLPAWVFTLAYSMVAALVVLAWFVIPPARPPRARSSQG